MNMSDEKQRPQFVASVDVQMMTARLLDAKVGDLVTYDELNELIGRDCRRSGIQSAIRAAKRDGAIFGCVTDKGYKRLNDAEIVDTGAAAARHIHRTSKRTIETLSKVDYTGLKQEDQLRHNVHMTTMTLAAASTSTASQKRVEQKVADANSALPAAKAALAVLGDIDSPRKK